MTRPDLAPGWVDRLVPVHGETNEEQRQRASGGRPFKQRGKVALAKTVKRGARKGAEAKKLIGALGPEPEEDG